MSELETLLNDIEKLRQNLHELINQKHVGLTDPEIVSASQMLNAAILKYTEIINNKVNDNS